MSDDTNHPRTTRRQFIRKAALTTAGIVLGVEGIRRGNEALRDKGQLDLEQEIADETLDQVKSSQLSSAQEQAYGGLKQIIDMPATPGQIEKLSQCLDQPWMNSKDFAGGVIAKAMAYTLSTNSKNAGEMLKVMVDKLPCKADEISFVTCKRKDETRDVKSLVELANDGFIRDYPRSKAGPVIFRDPALSAELKDHIEAQAARFAGPKRY